MNTLLYNILKFNCGSKTFFVALIVALACAPTMAATSILDTQGFETYSVGALQGQFAGVKPWLTVGSGAGTAAVANSVGVDGSKGVRVDRGARSDDWWAVSYSGSGLPTSRYVLVDWDMQVNATGAGGTVQGPFMGVETYDDTSIPKLLGSLGVDATTRDVLYVDPITGNLTETGLTLDTGWHHFQIRLDYLSDLYSTSVDNVSLLAQPAAFVDGASSTFSDADIAAVAAGADSASQRQTATAFFDNFKVRQIAPGDYNLDGAVDAADYVIWRHNAGAMQPSLAADGDGNGNVNQADYDVWRSSFGSAAPALAVANLVVPEPSTLMLMISACALLGHRSANWRNPKFTTVR